MTSGICMCNVYTQKTDFVGHMGTCPSFCAPFSLCRFPRYLLGHAGKRPLSLSLSLSPHAPYRSARQQAAIIAVIKCSFSDEQLLARYSRARPQCAMCGISNSCWCSLIDLRRTVASNVPAIAAVTAQCLSGNHSLKVRTGRGEISGRPAAEGRVRIIITASRNQENNIGD